MKSNDPPIVLAKMEATEEGNKEVAARYAVQGYPTIKVRHLSAAYRGVSGTTLTLSQKGCCAVKSQADNQVVQVFKGGDLEGSVEYKGPRDADGIVSYLRKQAGPAYVVLKGETEVCSQSLMPRAAT